MTKAATQGFIHAINADEEEGGASSPNLLAMLQLQSQVITLQSNYNLTYPFTRATRCRPRPRCRTRPGLEATPPVENEEEEEDTPSSSSSACGGVLSPSSSPSSSCLSHATAPVHPPPPGPPRTVYVTRRATWSTAPLVLALRVLDLRQYEDDADPRVAAPLAISIAVSLA